MSDQHYHESAQDFVIFVTASVAAAERAGRSRAGRGRRLQAARRGAIFAPEVPMQCERCGAGPAGADLFDYCGLCGQTLCAECMAAGCCGQSPAVSGRTQDLDPDDDEEVI